MIEEWRNIRGVALNYQVSNLGRIRNIKPPYENNPRIIGGVSKTRNGKKRHMVRLLTRNDGWKTFSVSKLVAQEFIKNPNKYTNVVHVNGILTDNRVSNLRWAKSQTAGIMLKKARNDIDIKICGNDVIIKDYKEGLSAGDICKKYKLSISRVDKIITNYNKEQRKSFKDKIVSDYKSGNYTKTELSKKYKVDLSYISRLTKDL